MQPAMIKFHSQLHFYNDDNQPIEISSFQSKLTLTKQ